MRGAAILITAALCAVAQDRTISSESEIRIVGFSKDGNTLFGVGADRKVHQWDVRSGSHRNATQWNQDERFVSMLPASSLYVLGVKGGIVLSELGNGAVVHRVALGERGIGQVAVAQDRQAVAGSSRVAGNSRDEMMRLWDVSGKERFTVPSGTGGTSTLAISPDGSVLAAGSWDTNVRIWSTRNGELLRLIEDLPVSMFGLAFSPDGRNLAGAGVDRTVYLWDTKTWKLERKLTGQPEMISTLAFSPDGRLLATGGFNDITQKHPVSVLLWDIATGKVLRKMPAPHRVSSVAFSTDSKLIAAASGDKTVRLWAVR